MADDAPKVLGGTAIRPKERHGWEAVKYLLYNPETGEVLTRTPKSWALITVFYLIYYSCLAAFWAAMMAVFLQTLPTEHRPKLETTAGLIGKSPGLGLRPAQSADFVDSSMIMYDPDEQSSWQGWATRCKEFLDKNYDKNKKPTESPEFDITTLGPCGKGNYGYDEGKPCIFLKLNKIYNLEHTYYTKENIDSSNPAFKELEEESQKSLEDMPEELKKFIEGKSGEDAKQVWVDCQPKNPADKEVLPKGKITYYPERGFPHKYFPFKGQENYRSPLVAVQFEPKTRGQLVHIECRAWAGNIGYNRRDKIGIASFEIRLL